MHEARERICVARETEAVGQCSGSLWASIGLELRDTGTDTFKNSIAQVQDIPTTGPRQTDELG